MSNPPGPHDPPGPRPGPGDPAPTIPPGLDPRKKGYRPPGPVRHALYPGMPSRHPVETAVRATRGRMHPAAA